MSVDAVASVEPFSQKPTDAGVKLASPMSVHLDAIRGMAALAVFLEHWRNLFFVDYSQLQHFGILVKVFYALTGLGHSAVMVFFVLSGFFISSSVIRSTKQGRWSWVWYAEQRLTRLYVVLVPALVLGGIWDFIGSHYILHAPIYMASRDYQNMIKHPVAQMLTLKAGIGNLFFLQGIRSPIFGSNGPLWSLSYEFWYYVLFPVGILALLRKSSLILRVGYAILGIIIFFFIGKLIALYFLVWLLGALIGLCPSIGITKSKSLGVCLGLLFIATILAPRFKLIPTGVLSDVLVSTTFAALLYFILNHAFQPPPRSYAKVAHACSNASYSLYLVHVPILVFLNACIIGHSSRWLPASNHLIQSILVAGFVFLYTYGVWYLTEAKTGQVRKKISTLLGR